MEIGPQTGNFTLNTILHPLIKFIIEFSQTLFHNAFILSHVSFRYLLIFVDQVIQLEGVSLLDLHSHHIKIFIFLPGIEESFFLVYIEKVDRNIFIDLELVRLFILIIDCLKVLFNTFQLFLASLLLWIYFIHNLLQKELQNLYLLLSTKRYPFYFNILLNLLSQSNIDNPSYRIQKSNNSLTNVMLNTFISKRPIVILKFLAFVLYSFCFTIQLVMQIAAYILYVFVLDVLDLLFYPVKSYLLERALRIMNQQGVGDEVVNLVPAGVSVCLLLELEQLAENDFENQLPLRH